MNLKRARTFISALSKEAGPIKATSIFRKVKYTARNVFNADTIKKDWLVRGASATGRGVGWTGNKIGGAAKYIRNSPIGRTTKTIATSKVGRGINKFARTGARLLGPTAGASAIAAGAVGMLSLSIMNGANNAAKDIILERYMADQRFTRDILLQSRVGTAMGTDRMNRYGGTIGLSNSLSRTRHGASY